jgi:predicted transcriptional regulator
MIRRRPIPRFVLGLDAVAIIERLAVVPWESVEELSNSTGLSAERVIAGLAKARKAGLINTWPKGTTPKGKQ